ncbi:uncharacterized protein BP01DRAFT_412161 [Aspergillus saccharolyticus JOP 1030-1]|uniref:Uncharacterized protein n=1 Tax=Aspergillus saccharolyticus JOP 1030-1 TaxID=1450539 RepID=A0A318Z0Z7_9EURO|nr:hypothetical protein BP01DRAFT_412161 [Aspergillus saccharolyticus JOP 1030-1]PYH40044.1 hypothetical protein BP01DRAFT_412161 [Aspergillus saccharolyticus JOP 1030-1]
MSIITSSTAIISTSDPKVGWQDGSDRRGTWEIITTSHALFELVMAVQSTVDIQNNGQIKTARYNWIIKLYLVIVGDRSFNKALNTSNDSEQCNTSEKIKWTITHSYFANMGGIYNNRKVAVTAAHISQIPEVYNRLNLTEDMVKDKGKRDYFAKGLAVLQISQLVLSLIVRAYRNLPFSQLETLTLAFSVCGVATYVAYWYKPQDVGLPISIKEMNGLESRRFDKSYDNFWNILTNSERSSTNEDYDRIENDNIPKGTSQITHGSIPVLAMLSAAFGSLHLIAWNFEFPTNIEQLLWRITTIASVAVPVMGLITIPLAQITIPAGDPREFMRDCLRLLRELSWDQPDRQDIRQARADLEKIYIEPDFETDAARMRNESCCHGANPEHLPDPLNLTDPFDLFDLFHPLTALHVTRDLLNLLPAPDPVVALRLVYEPEDSLTK